MLQSAEDTADCNVFMLAALTYPLSYTSLHISYEIIRISRLNSDEIGYKIMFTTLFSAQ